MAENSTINFVAYLHTVLRGTSRCPFRIIILPKIADSPLVMKWCCKKMIRDHLKKKSCQIPKWFIILYYRGYGTLCLSISRNLETSPDGRGFRSAFRILVMSILKYQTFWPSKINTKPWIRRVRTSRGHLLAEKRTILET